METTVYITKYALSDGIKKINAKVASGYCISNDYGILQSFYKDEFHLTEEQALANAELRRNKKIASLKKQIEKLEKMTFKIKLQNT